MNINNKTTTKKHIVKKNSYAIISMYSKGGKKMKKFLSIFAIVALVVLLTGCGANKNVSGTLEEIMDKLYVNIPEDERPMLTNIEITDENVEGFLGTADIEYEEALASESATGSIAHSVVLIRVKDNVNVEAIKEKIENSVNPRKWICVQAEDVEVESKGNLIVLIMSSETNVEKIENSFKNLK